MNRDFSLIDANINRAREGLRVIEEACRFVFRDRELFSEVKQIRHKLTPLEQSFGPAHKLSGRVGEDIGKNPVVESEYNRCSVWDILRASFNRAVESLRVLEEFAKIYSKGQALQIEDLRYRLYVLEYKVLTLTPHYWLNKYFEQGIVYPISDKIDELIWLIDHGAKVIQLRDKVGSKKEIYQKAKHLCRYIDKLDLREKVLFIINDHADIAAKLPVAGVHMGEDDGIINEVRRKIGIDKIIGRSNNSLEQVQQAIADGADYVSIGAVFPTPTKPDRKAVGLEVLKQVAEEIKIPLVAIGGIDSENIQGVKETDVKNIAVVRAAREFFV